MPVRVLIVDDEPLARERLRELLDAHPEVEVAGEARDGREAVSMIAAAEAELVFLDVRMPELDGFEVLAALDPERIPAVIFVTAYDEHALRAFEVSAVDYLVKPFSRARFDAALERALARLAPRDGAPAAPPLGEDRLRELLERLAAERGYLARFVVRGGDGIFFVAPAEVAWLEAAGNYVRLHTAAGPRLVRATLRDLEERLDPRVFLRVHRSAIVNLDHVRKLEPYFHGEYTIHLRDGTRIVSSRSFSARLRDLIR